MTVPSEDVHGGTYSEPGRGYGSLLLFGAIIVVGVALDAVFGGLRAHLLGWLIAAVLLFGIDLIVIRAARSQKSLALTGDRLRVGEQSVARSDIVEAVATEERGMTVLGWPSGMPRGMDAVVLRLRDGSLVAVPTRHPDRLRRALGLGPIRAAADEVRAATPEDLPLLADVEARAATIFRVAGYDVPELPPPDYTTVQAKALFVAGRPPVAFARVDEVDDNAHLEELDVVPGHMRAGLGTLLIGHACAWARAQGYPASTLITFADVPWNGPFYRKRGFAEVTELTPGLAALREHEKSLGLDDVGPRVVMRREL
jgi:GNAT superfamily N-acetyltransferase